MAMPKGFKHSEKTKEKMRRHIFSEEHKKKLSELHKHRVYKPHTEETKRKISKAIKKLVLSGKHNFLTEEHREIARESSRNRIWSKESREKTSKSSLGRPAWNIGMIDSMSHCWKGNDVGTVALHTWVNKHKGKPKYCEHCNKKYTGEKRFHWANKDHSYKRNLDDFMWLCASCHKNWDIKYNNLLKKKENNG